MLASSTRVITVLLLLAYSSPPMRIAHQSMLQAGKTTYNYPISIFNFLIKHDYLLLLRLFHTDQCLVVCDGKLVINTQQCSTVKNCFSRCRETILNIRSMRIRWLMSCKCRWDSHDTVCMIYLSIAGRGPIDYHSAFFAESEWDDDKTLIKYLAAERSQ